MFYLFYLHTMFMFVVKAHSILIHFLYSFSALLLFLYFLCIMFFYDVNQDHLEKQCWSLIGTIIHGEVCLNMINKLTIDVVILLIRKSMYSSDLTAIAFWVL